MDDFVLEAGSFDVFLEFFSLGVGDFDGGHGGLREFRRLVSYLSGLE